MRQLVRVSTPALREMVLATVESYQLMRDKKRRAIEIYGHCWGYQRFVDDLVIYMVESVSISASSKGTHNSVEPHPEALALKQGIMERWYPQLTLLGDFHTHPYDSLSEVMRPDDDDPGAKGFEFSKADIGSFKKDDVIWESASQHPLMLVMTVCKLDRVRESQETSVRTNVQVFTIGEFRFWLNGCAGYPVDGKKRKKRAVSKDKASSLLMDIFPTAYNAARDRVLKELSPHG